MKKELWGIAVITGTCLRCGRENVKERKVNRGWITKRHIEPISFGYMGDCGYCGMSIGGSVEWKCLIVQDEVEVV